MDDTFRFRLFHGESAAREDGEHGRISREYLRLELIHSLLAGDADEMIQDRALGPMDRGHGLAAGFGDLGLTRLSGGPRASQLATEASSRRRRATMRQTIAPT